MSGFLAKTGAAVVALTLTSSALAGGYGYYGHSGRHGHGHSHGRHGSDWVAPLLILGIAGAAIAASSAREAPRPVYAPPVEYRQAPVYPPVAYPPVAYPPVAYSPLAPRIDNPVWWCASSGQYYPATTYCPENWQLVR